jgi:hypothetical protein
VVSESLSNHNHNNNVSWKLAFINGHMRSILKPNLIIVQLFMSLSDCPGNYLPKIVLLIQGLSIPKVERAGGTITASG